MGTNTNFEADSLITTLQVKYKIKVLLDEYARVENSFTVENSEKIFH